MIVGITGKAGAGKDTAADYLVQRHGFVKLSFASALKEGLNAMFGWSMHQWDDRAWKETVIDWIGKSPRQLAQTLGTEWGREQVHSSIWVDIAMSRAEILAQDGYNVVIADVRFDNEAEVIGEFMDGVVISVSRYSTEVSLHTSEQPIADHLIDARIANISNINTLHMDVASALNHLTGGTTWQTTE